MRIRCHGCGGTLQPGEFVGIGRRCWLCGRCCAVHPEYEGVIFGKVTPDGWLIEPLRNVKIAEEFLGVDLMPRAQHWKD